MRVVDAHATNAGDGFTAESRSVFLAVFSVAPRRHDAAAALTISKQSECELADGLHVEIAEGAAAGVSDVTGVGIDGADFLIPETPQIEEPLLAPDDVLFS